MRIKTVVLLGIVIAISTGIWYLLPVRQEHLSPDGRLKTRISASSFLYQVLEGLSFGIFPKPTVRLELINILTKEKKILDSQPLAGILGDGPFPIGILWHQDSAGFLYVYGYEMGAYKEAYKVTKHTPLVVKKTVDKKLIREIMAASSQSTNAEAKRVIEFLKEPVQAKVYNSHDH